jgi:hypothetical protein
MLVLLTEGLAGGSQNRWIKQGGGGSYNLNALDIDVEESKLGLHVDRKLAGRCRFDKR